MFDNALKESKQKWYVLFFIKYLSKTSIILGDPKTDKETKY